MDGMDDGARARMERVAARLRAIHDGRVARYRSRQPDEIERSILRSMPTGEQLEQAESGSELPFGGC